jgi:hypothetical protein
MATRSFLKSTVGGSAQDRDTANGLELENLGSLRGSNSFSRKSSSVRNALRPNNLFAEPILAVGNQSHGVK